MLSYCDQRAVLHSLADMESILLDGFRKAEACDTESVDSEITEESEEIAEDALDIIACLRDLIEADEYTDADIEWAAQHLKDLDVEPFLKHDIEARIAYEENLGVLLSLDTDLDSE